MNQQPDFAQNPDELFDVVNENGTPTGEVKRRADVHRDGDWHRAIHVWVYGLDDEGAFLLFNLRGRFKDTFPLCLDVTVGGHLAAGEGVEESFREVHEEIGIEPDTAQLAFLTTRKAFGEVERELQEVFLYRDDRPLTGYQPNPAELEGLVRISLDDALRIFAGETDQVDGILLRAADRGFEPFVVSADCLPPVDNYSYYLQIAQAVAQAVNA